MIPKPYSIWKYIGPGEGQGLLHRVVGTSVEEVTTWSQHDPDPDVGGWSWLGEAAEFFKQFAFVQ